LHFCVVIEEVAMPRNKPTKEQVREWQHDRIAQHKPPPDPKQIKRELGWDLIEAERQAEEAAARVQS